jgi:hypothetical protein
MQRAYLRKLESLKMITQDALKPFLQNTMASKINSIKDIPEWYFDAQIILSKNRGMSYIKLTKMINDMGHRNANGAPFSLNSIISSMNRYRKHEGKIAFRERNKNATTNN